MVSGLQLATYRIVIRYKIVIYSVVRYILIYCIVRWLSFRGYYIRAVTVDHILKRFLRIHAGENKQVCKILIYLCKLFPVMFNLNDECSAITIF